MRQTDIESENVISLYAVFRNDGLYFGGYDTKAGKALFVDSPFKAKLFTNKFDINLRPDEQMVELRVSVGVDNTIVTTPFKPKRKNDLI